MEERSIGIVLRTRPLTETSLIVQWLTRDHGRIATAAKGARRPKSPFIGKLDLFYEAEFSFARSRKSDLHTLREVSLRETHASLREDIRSLRQASYFAVLIEKGSERDTPLLEYYELMKEALGALSTSISSTALVFSFEMKFLHHSGFQPLVASLSPAAQMILERLALAPLGGTHDLPVNNPIRAELSNFLGRAIGTSLEKLPPERERALRA
ncbi:MAG TPA: DNA repair protein RecO [Verrucomicrobiae bacterium]|nr:DNA repair protein RecO [Verrucomicrobiae bacterium]